MGALRRLGLRTNPVVLAGSERVFDHRLAAHLAAHGVGDEALFVRAVVQGVDGLGGGAQVAAEVHLRVQGDLGKGELACDVCARVPLALSS